MADRGTVGTENVALPIAGKAVDDTVDVEIQARLSCPVERIERNQPVPIGIETKAQLAVAGRCRAAVLA